MFKSNFEVLFLTQCNSYCISRIPFEIWSEIIKMPKYWTDWMCQFYKDTGVISSNWTRILIDSAHGEPRLLDRRNCIIIVCKCLVSMHLFLFIIMFIMRPFLSADEMYSFGLIV